MGLDMYLSKQTDLGNLYVEEKNRNTVTVQGPMADFIDTKKIAYLSEEMAYWRKANQIHRWFVENVQQDKDDCGKYYVAEEDLKRLLDNVDAVLTDPKKAEKLLPPSAGYFFGSLDIDDSYFDDLRYTQKVLREVLKNPLKIGQSYYYESSW